MPYSRERNRNVVLNDLSFRTNKKPADAKNRTVSLAVVAVLMLLSVAGEAVIFVLFILGIFAAIAGAMYFLFKSQVVDDGTAKPEGSVKNIGLDIMRTIREKSEKEGDPMFKEARAHQKRNPTPADYARIERCSHEESLKSLLEAGIIDRAEYVERLRKLNCSAAH